MARKETNHYARLATWLDAHRLPGEERAFQDWIDESEEHVMEWNQWQLLTDKSRRLSPEPLNVDAAWATLRERVGLRRMRRSEVKLARSSKDYTVSVPMREVIRRPLALALISMTLLSIYLLLLYFIRVKLGF